MSKPTVYLAGPVAAYDDGGAAWRDDIKQDYDGRCEFKDPLSKYNVPLDELEVVPGHSGPDEATVGVAELVEQDKRLIRKSDAVLVGYTDVQSIGTPMEVMYVRERDYPVALWVRDQTPREEVSPWYRYHATATTHLSEAAIAHCEGAVL